LLSLRSRQASEHLDRGRNPRFEGRERGLIRLAVCVKARDHSAIEPDANFNRRRAHRDADSINSMISRARQQVVRGPNRTGFGYLPAFTPAHQLDPPTGTRASTCGNLRRACGSIATPVTDLSLSMMGPTLNALSARYKT
jgi:hypothetical protein